MSLFSHQFLCTWSHEGFCDGLLRSHALVSPRHRYTSLSPRCVLRSPSLPFHRSGSGLKNKRRKKPKTQQAPVQVSTAVLFKKSRSMLRSLGVHSIHHHLFLFISFWPGRHVYFITRYEPWKARRIVRSLVWRFIEADRSACDCAIKINAQLKCLCAIKIGAFLARHLHNSTVRSFHF